VIRLMVPVYGATPQGASPDSGYEIPLNASPDAEAPGSLADGALDGAVLADGVLPVHAATIAAMPMTAANRRDRLVERVMRWFSSYASRGSPVILPEPTNLGHGSTPVSVPATVRGNLSTRIPALLGVRSGVE